MGEAENRNRKSSGSNILLIMTGMLLLAVIALAVYIIPRAGAVFSEYGKQHASLKEVRTELAEAEKARDALLEEKQLMQTDDGEIATLKNETFKSALQLEKDINAGLNDSKICYLTFDDGPYYRGKNILKILNQYDVKATFFLTTANGDRLPDNASLSAASMYPEYLRYGHTIGNHTYSHDYYSGGIYKNAKAFMDSVNKQQEFTAKAAGGLKPEIVRFPGGRSTAGGKLEDIEEALREAGLGWVDWTVDSGDSWGKGSASPKVIMKQIKKAAKDQKIMVVLCHEWSTDTEKALPEMIGYLRGQGYIFLPLFYDSTVVMK